MKKEIVKSDLAKEKYYQINHPTGLTILVWPMEGFSSTEALFATKYGSINTIFKTDKENDYAEVPEGIAHFLEHKLFENEDCDVFELYAKTGANANAYTSFDKTSYLFSCSDKYQESLRILLSFVQQPYFTEDTVKKEQGIIGQEIRMCDDNPDWRVFFNLLKAMYVNHPVKIDIAGTVESIAKIDAKLLYRCYHTFYNLNNMVLSIAGNCDVDEVLKICDECLKTCEDIKLETKMPDEPDDVNTNEIIEYQPVGTPLFNIGFKVKPKAGKELLRKEMVSGILLSLIAGSTSSLYKQLFNEGLINSNFGSETFTGDGYFANIYGGESKDPQEVLRRIVSEIDRIKKEGFDKAQFEIVKKSKYGQMIRSFNNVEACATLMQNSYLAGANAFDPVEALADISFEELSSSLNELFDTSKVSISIILKNKKGE